MHKIKRKILTVKIFAAIGMLSFFPFSAFAACSNPAGDEGAIIYNQDYNVPQYCDGTDWHQMAPTVLSGFGGPADCPNIGDQCNDSTIFAGTHPFEHVWLFIHPNNQSTGSMWSSSPGGVPLYETTSARHEFDGRINQEWIETNRDINDYHAFKLCYDLNQVSALGFNDWYLPSRIEVFHIYTYRADINAGPGDNFSTDLYWSSSDQQSDGAWAVNFNSQFVYLYLKNHSGGDVRCMRRRS